MGPGGWRVLLVLALLPAFSSTARSSEEADYPDLVAADEEDELIDEFVLLAEDAMVESAARHKQKIGMSPSAITVITRQDIEASGVTTIPDLLRLVPGMNVVISNPFFTAITTRLYWTEENNHLMVLIDGREANFDPLGFTPWEAQPILLQDIERIEVIRGPGSSLYGANAMAGVVTITTRDIPDKTSVWVHADAGEDGRFISGLRASTRMGNWGLSLGGGTYFSGNSLQPRQVTKEIWKFRSVAEYRWSDTQRFLADFSLTRTWGPMASPMGTVDCIFHPNMLRLAFDSETLKAHVYYTYTFARAEIKTPLEYSQVRLALFKPAPIESHVVDGQVQWTLPTFFEPLLLIGGGGARAAWMGSDAMIDAETFDNPQSPDYHQPGISHWELRGGVFVHAEYAPTHWVTVTGGTRFDYNTQTGAFLSPRLAAVFRPAAGQYIRLGAARSFRKPAFLETVAHLMVDFPDDSPITGTGQNKFLEFMTRVGGNNKLDNEELVAFEAGYLGQFLDERLSVGLDLYYNMHWNVTQMDSKILPDAQGLPDLELSSFTFANLGSVLDVLGSELSVRY
jgi:outer membrane receptor for ferrienterochelin and colicin